jgi:hypothetical protein
VQAFLFLSFYLSPLKDMSFAGVDTHALLSSSHLDTLAQEQEVQQAHKHPSTTTPPSTTAASYTNASHAV